MSPALSEVLNQVDKLDTNDLDTLERAIQAKRRLLAAKKPRGAVGRLAEGGSPEQVRQARMFESVWDSE
jgi:hypothetical protein